MKYYIIAGEASGDLHGSNLMKGLKKNDPSSEFRFWGGDLMSAVGGVLVKHYKDSAVMGVVEVIKNLGKISNNLRYCKSDLLAHKPDVLILIDYPGFNFKMAAFAKAHGIKVFYYIAPKVWAWQERRIKWLKKNVDKLFIIFPFEVEYFKSKGINAIYEGNPLIDSISQDTSCTEPRSAFFSRNDLEDRPVIALLAGSRKMEINYLMSRFLALEKMLSQSEYSNYHLLLAGAPSIDRGIYDKYLEGSKIKVLYGETYSILKNASAAVINSGTASLEAAIIGTPQVVCYGMNEISYLLARSFIKINSISLANIILNRHIFKELIQHDCTPENMFEELKLLISNIAYRDKMICYYEELNTILGGKGASDKVALKMIELLSE